MHTVSSPARDVRMKHADTRSRTRRLGRAAVPTLSGAAGSVSDARPRRNPPAPGSWTLGSPNGGGALDQLVEAVLGVRVPRAAGVRVQGIPARRIGCLVWAGWCPWLEVELLKSVALMLPGSAGGGEQAMRAAHIQRPRRGAQHHRDQPRITRHPPRLRRGQPLYTARAEHTHRSDTGDQGVVVEGEVDLGPVHPVRGQRAAHTPASFIRTITSPTTDRNGPRGAPPVPTLVTVR